MSFYFWWIKPVDEIIHFFQHYVFCRELSISFSSDSQKLEQHLARFSNQYDQLVAFKPTGWTFSQQVESVGHIQPDVSGNISIYGMTAGIDKCYIKIELNCKES